MNFTKTYNYIDCYQWLLVAKRLPIKIPKDIIKYIAKFLIVYYIPENNGTCDFIWRRPECYIGNKNQREYIFTRILMFFLDGAQQLINNNLNGGTIEVKVIDNTISIYSQYQSITCNKYLTTDFYVPEMIFFTRGAHGYDINKPRDGINSVGVGITSVFSDVDIDIVNKNEGVHYSQSSIFNFKSLRVNTTIPRITPISKIVNDYMKVSYTMKDDVLPPKISKDEFINLCSSKSFCYNIPFNLNYENEIMKFDFTSIFDYTLFCLKDQKWYIDINSFKRITYEDEDTRFIMLYTPGKSNICSYVNGIYTPKGGAHVNAWIKALKFSSETSRSNKYVLKNIMNNVTLCLSVHVDSPRFNSQDKERLESPSPKVNIDEAMANEFSTWVF